MSKSHLKVDLVSLNDVEKWYYLTLRPGTCLGSDATVRGERRMDNFEWLT